ncbi:MAG: hypothetical protein ACK5OS_01870 [Chryseotalea sp.]
MKPLTITTGNLSITFEKKYFIIQGNNGNHTGYNRYWVLNSEGYNTKKEAEKIYREMVRKNGDIKHGLTPLRIVTGSELIEIYESPERLKFFNCIDIKVDENS